MFLNRLKELRQKNGVKQKDIASMLGVTAGAVSQWESGRVNIDWRCATTLAEKFHVTPEYLLGETDIIDSASIQAPAAVRIPVVGTIRAGIPLAAIEDIEDWEEIPADMAKKGEFVALRVKGDSMLPDIKDGDIAIIRRQESIENGQIAAVIVNGEEATIKKVRLLPDGIMLIGLNTEVYEPHFYSKQEISDLPVRIYGKLIEVRRKFY